MSVATRACSGARLRSAAARRLPACVVELSRYGSQAVESRRFGEVRGYGSKGPGTGFRKSWRERHAAGCGRPCSRAMVLHGCTSPRQCLRLAGALELIAAVCVWVGVADFVAGAAGAWADVALQRPQSQVCDTGNTGAGVRASRSHRCNQ